MAVNVLGEFVHFFVGSTGVRRRAFAIPAVVALILSFVTVSVVGAVSATADPGGPVQRPVGLVTADSLPTAQINGVAWAQAIAGTRVYAGGEFTSARPAGAALGVQESARGNLLAYDLATGNLISTFAPKVNAAVRAIAVSPDGTRVYIGGNFTSIDGVARFRLAALNAATGALITTFAAGVDYNITSVVATNSTVYVGGAFSNVGTSKRTRLAAFSASNGALLAWAPGADAGIQSMVLSPDGTKLIVGGSFLNLTSSGSTTLIPSTGIGAIDTTTGAVVRPWNTNLLIRNGGANGAITTLSSDGTSIYGGGYKFGTGANFEGTFKIDPTNGTVQWIEDCHGDVYGVYASPVAMYEVGHSHYCGNNMGWPQPTTWNFNRGVAFTKNATGTLTRDAIGGSYTNFGGTASPSLLSWFPRLDVGTFTGKSQAAWSVTGNAQYVLLGGEFPLVNNAGQQGLARFAVTPSTGKKQGVRLSGASFAPTVTSPTAGKVRIQFKANWDRDDRNLTYTIQRTAPTAANVFTTTVASSEWDRPTIGFVDTVAAGQTATYRIQVKDADGNSATGNSASVTVAASGALSSYGQTVLSQGASLYWPLNETAGTTAYDYAGFNYGTLDTGVTRGASGAMAGNTAMTFSGAAGGDLAGQSTLTSPNTFTAQAWFKTTSTQGGRIIGFSDLATENSAHRDRQIYMNNTGKISFGVYSTTASSLTSARSYNDGVWHQAVATLSTAGMSLYVDGALVGQRADVTSGEKYPGYWRIGGDSTAGWTNAGTSGYFAGGIDEVSVYPTALTLQQVAAQYTASGRTPGVTQSPADAYGAMVYTDQPIAYWRLGDAPGEAAAPDSGPVNNPGTYMGGVTKGATGAISGTTNTAVTLNGSTGFISSNASFVNPTAYSTEAWFKTTTTTGGSIVGFGNARTGTSTTADRRVYMQNTGRLSFSAGTTTPVVISSANAYNNGLWHHVVATQGPSGMVLYVDGAQVATSPNTSSGNYTGFWRAGGDLTGGSTSNYLNGTIDEVAVYNKVLTAARVAQHRSTGVGG